MATTVIANNGYGPTARRVLIVNGTAAGRHAQAGDGLQAYPTFVAELPARLRVKSIANSKIPADILSSLQSRTVAFGVVDEIDLCFQRYREQILTRSRIRCYIFSCLSFP